MARPLMPLRSSGIPRTCNVIAGALAVCPTRIPARPRAILSARQRKPFAGGTAISDRPPTEPDFAQRVAAVDEEAAIGSQRTCDPTERLLLELAVASVERPDACGEGEVERLFTGLELEVFDGDATKAEAARSDLRRARCLSLCYGPGGSIASTWPSPTRRAISRAAAPGPQPISRTRIPGRRGRASTRLASRGDSFAMVRC